MVMQGPPRTCGPQAPGAPGERRTPATRPKAAAPGARPPWPRTSAGGQDQHIVPMDMAIGGVHRRADCGRQEDHQQRGGRGHMGREGEGQDHDRDHQRASADAKQPGKEPHGKGDRQGHPTPVAVGHLALRRLQRAHHRPASRSRPDPVAHGQQEKEAHQKQAKKEKKALAVEETVGPHPHRRARSAGQKKEERTGHVHLPVPQIGQGGRKTRGGHHRQRRADRLLRCEHLAPQPRKRQQRRNENDAAAKAEQAAQHARDHTQDQKQHKRHCPLSHAHAAIVSGIVASRQLFFSILPTPPPEHPPLE